MQFLFSAMISSTLYHYFELNCSIGSNSLVANQLDFTVEAVCAIVVNSFYYIVKNEH